MLKANKQLNRGTKTLNSIKRDKIGAYDMKETKKQK